MSVRNGWDRLVRLHRDQPRILLEVDGRQRELTAIEINQIVHDLQDEQGLKTRHDMGLVFADEALRQFAYRPTDSGWVSV